MKNKPKKKKYHFYKISFYPADTQYCRFLGNTMATSRKAAAKKICKENNIKYSEVKDDLVIELIR